MTGSDEYTTVVDDYAYTNLMAKENIEHFGEPLRLGPGAAVVRPATTALPGPRTGELPRAA